MVQELPLLSIIVPVYKVEKYLSACLDSILVQTYANFELIVIDDGSPDGCADICESYAARDQRVRVIHQQNAGLAAARNRGLDEAKGELIGFVDSDDTISPDMYSVLYEALSASKADICVCNYRCVDEMGHPVGEEDLPIKDEVIVGVSAIIKKLEEDKNWFWVTAWNKLYRRELLESLRFPQGKLHEDEFIIHHILVRCNKAACVSEALYIYLKRGGSITGSSFTLNRLDAAEALFDRAKVLMEHGVSSYSAYYACSVGLMVMTKGYVCLDIHDSHYRKRYKELCMHFRSAAAMLLRSDLALVWKIRLFFNRISPYYIWKYMERLMRKSGAGSPQEYTRA